MDDPQTTYDVLLGIRGTGPTQREASLPYVTRNDPEASYLYLKITGAAREGASMPLGAALPDAAIADIAEWISQGANNN